ncbi:hypothetical protein ACQKPE_16015 [Pseudomonas sp. NPDC089554]|uniref:hypothetical protein n=1 Tax=Pseudomonas sp. NPDC089554 TaxID=3390653 RepID=UPI003D024B50
MRNLIIAILSVLISGCGMFPSYQTPFSVRNPLIDGSLEGTNNQTTTFLSEKAQSWVDKYKKLRDDPRKENIRPYVGSGIAYSNLICRDYFERLSLTKAHRDHAKKETNLVGGLTASLMGLAKASAGGIAATSAAFSFGSASFDAYDEAFLVSPNIAELEKLVQRKQEQVEILTYRKLDSTAKWPDGIESMDEADRALNSYIEICTPNGIRNLLTESIEEKKAKTVEKTKAINESAANVSTTTLQLNAETK